MLRFLVCTSGGGGMSKKHPMSDLVLTAATIKTVKPLCYTVWATINSWKKTKKNTYFNHNLRILLEVLHLLKITLLDLGFGEVISNFLGGGRGGRGGGEEGEGGGGGIGGGGGGGEEGGEGGGGSGMGGEGGGMGGGGGGMEGGKGGGGGRRGGGGGKRGGGKGGNAFGMGDKG